MSAQRGAISVLDAGIGIKRRCFADQCLFDRLLGRDVPGVKQIEILQVLGHQRFVGQARAFILGGVLGNRQRRRHGFTNCFRPTGGSTGRAFALPGIQRDTKTLVAIEFNSFHFTLAHRRRQPLLQRHGYFTGAGPLALGLGKDLLDLFLQCR